MTRLSATTYCTIYRERTFSNVSQNKSILHLLYINHGAHLRFTSSTSLAVQSTTGA
jgi:hypothetical protein